MNKHVVRRGLGIHISGSGLNLGARAKQPVEAAEGHTGH